MKRVRTENLQTWRNAGALTRRPYARGLALVLLSISALAASNPAPPPAPEPPPPTTPLGFYNAGTEKLNQGKLREAEAFLESALASQVERLQPPALYNLGHVRFRQGVEALKKGPAASNTLEGSRRTVQTADSAIQQADAALAGNDLDALVASYLRGRGARKELKAATAAVKQALQTHRATLSAWQRSSDDFKSSVELKPTDTAASSNAEVVDRCIAKLVDTIRQLEQMAQALGQKQKELGEKVQKMKGRIPAQNMPPGAPGDDEDDDQEQPFGPKPGQEEGPTRDGEEMRLSPEQAGWLLNGYKLDSERRLPMGGDQQAQPKSRNRPTW